MDISEVRQQIRYNLEVSEQELGLFIKVFGKCRFSDYPKSEYSQIETIYEQLGSERCPF